MRDELEMAAHIKEEETLNGSTGRHDVGLEAQRTKFFFDAAFFAVMDWEGQRDSRRAQRGNAFGMGDLRGGLGDAKARQAEMPAVGSVDIEANGREVNVNGIL